MKLTPTTAPGREIVLAYTLTFGNEGAKLVLADLTRLVEEMATLKTDKTGRMDPLKLAATDGMRTMLDWINAMRTMQANPEWQAIERTRQLTAAQHKEATR